MSAKIHHIYINKKEEFEKMEAEKIPVGQINSNHFHKSITVQGKITAIGSIKPKLITGAFKCQKCGEITFANQDDSDKLIEPYECLNDVCGRKNELKLLHKESDWMDERQFILQDVKFSDREITVIVRGLDLINKIGEVSACSDVTGEIHIIEGKKGFDKILLATNIENTNIERHHVRGSMGRNDQSYSKQERERIEIIRGIIKELQKSFGAAPIEDIISRAEENGIGKEQIDDLISRLKSAGEVIEISHEKYRAV